MVKIELPLAEVQKLNIEVEGLLKEKLPVYIKFKLHTLKKRMHDSVESMQAIQKELFEKYGYKDNGSYKIRMDSENYTIFTKEMEELSKQNVELEYEPIKLSTIENVESSDNLDIFFKLVIQDNPL